MVRKWQRAAFELGEILGNYPLPVLLPAMKFWSSEERRATSGPVRLPLGAFSEAAVTCTNARSLHFISFSV